MITISGAVFLTISFHSCVKIVLLVFLATNTYIHPRAFNPMRLGAHLSDHKQTIKH